MFSFLDEPIGFFEPTVNGGLSAAAWISICVSVFVVLLIAVLIVVLIKKNKK